MVFGIILEQREEEQKADKNVVMYQRRNVPTSRRRVNEKRKSTSDQRRDVSAISASTSLKAKGPEIDEGIGKRTDEGTKSIAAATQISGEDTFFYIFFFPKKRLMIYRLIKCIIKSSMFEIHI